MLSAIVCNQVRNISITPSYSMILLYLPTLIHLGWPYLRPSIIRRLQDSSSYKLWRYVVQVYFSYISHSLSIRVLMHILPFRRHLLASRRTCVSKIISPKWDKKYDVYYLSYIFYFLICFPFLYLYNAPAQWRHGRSVMQRPAKPCSPVQLWVVSPEATTISRYILSNNSESL